MISGITITTVRAMAVIIFKGIMMAVIYFKGLHQLPNLLDLLDKKMSVALSVREVLQATEN